MYKSNNKTYREAQENSELYGERFFVTTHTHAVLVEEIEAGDLSGFYVTLYEVDADEFYLLNFDYFKSKTPIKVKCIPIVGYHAGMRSEERSALYAMHAQMYRNVAMQMLNKACGV